MIMITVRQELTYENLKDGKKLYKYLKCVAQMQKEDLERLNEEKVKALKENIGLLWHYRLGHVLKGYLKEASKSIPELKKTKFDNAITEYEVCKRAKIVREVNVLSMMNL